MNQSLKFRASVDSKVIGYAKTLPAAKRILSAKKIKEVGGSFASGYIDQFDHEQEPNDWMQVAQRVIASSGNPAGWYNEI
jgi:hypothetical protein